MKKLICLCVCLMLVLSAAGCGKKDGADTQNAPISDIGTATADKEEAKEEAKAESDNKDKEGKADKGGNNTADRTEETDRQEIKNNLRDARELIDDGAIEDAEMILDVIRTRDLTDEEKEELLELEKLMLVVSD